MRYAKYLSVIVCTLFACSLNVNAAGRNTCPTSVKKELSRETNYVKVDYETIDKSEYKDLTIGDDTTKYKIPKYEFQFTIYNLTENLYATIETSSENNSRKMDISYDMTDNGQYTFTDTNIGDIYNYTIYIKSNNAECIGSQLRTLKITKPRYNAYSEFAYCQNSSSYYCQRFIGTELNIKSTEDFLSKIKVNNEKNNPDNDREIKKIAELFKENWKLYLIMLVAIAVLVVGGIFVLQKYRKKKGWRL